MTEMSARATACQNGVKFEFNEELGSALEEKSTNSSD